MVVNEHEIVGEYIGGDKIFVPEHVTDDERGRIYQKMRKRISEVRRIQANVGPVSNL